MRRAATGVIAGLFLSACGRGDAGGSGRILVSWTGADTGRLETRAFARWCAEDSVLEIVGEAGDSGVAVALFPQGDTVLPGVVPLGPPGSGRARPRGGVALRWFGENMIAGYYTLSGIVTVEESPGLAGRIEATVKNAMDGRQLTVAGEFEGLAITRSSVACASPDTSTPSDSVPDSAVSNPVVP